jgi:hypothetical protein
MTSRARTNGGPKTKPQTKPAPAKKQGGGKKAKAPSKLQLLQMAAASDAASAGCEMLGFGVNIAYLAPNLYVARWNADGADYEVRGNPTTLMFWIGCATAAGYLATDYPNAVTERAVTVWRQMKGVAA